MNMFKLFSVGLFMCLISLATPDFAVADTYTPTFTPDAYSISVPTAPDVTFPSPAITETWDGYSMTITLASSDSPTDSYQWSNISGDGAYYDFDYNLAFEIYDETTGISSIVYEDVSSPAEDYSSGALTFSDPPATTPEPGTASFLIIGVGMLGVMARNRIRRRLPQAS